MDWRKFERELHSLASRIEWKPDAVVGITRGGVIPAAMLARICDARAIHIIRVRHVGSRRKVEEGTLPELAGKKVLLVEDMTKTGKSMAAAKTYLEEKGAQVKTACLYTMPGSEIAPDFSLKEIRAVAVFPWEE